MPSISSRVLRSLLKFQTTRADKNATLDQRRKALENGARYLPMPRHVVVEQTMIGSIPAEWLRPVGLERRRTVLYLHGGAYTMGSLTTHRALASRIAVAGQAWVLLPQFRLAPENPFPATIEDAMDCYRWILDHEGSPHRTVVVGDSSGGGLAVALALLARDEGVPLPAGVACLSPWADLEMKGKTITTRAQVDPICSLDDSRYHAALYAKGVGPRASLVSPIHADLSGLPPVLIQVGDCEILLDDSIRLAQRARNDGVDVELEVWDGMWHVWQLFAWYVPEGRQAIERIGGFIRQHARPD
jgi:monoterpene epsilon-lactone hydrolase